MATAAFKSNSRRGNVVGGGSENEKKVPPPPAPPQTQINSRRRRSLSVSAAVSRTTSQPQQDPPPDFLNKRDNPLFWTTTSPPDNETQPQNAGALTSKAANASQSQRGRSVTRHSDQTDIIGTSLSRINTPTSRRGRSLSRGRYGYGYATSASEKEVEQETDVVSSNYRNTSNSNLASSNVKRPNSVTKNVAGITRDRTSRSQSNHRPAIEPLDNSASNLQIPHWEDGISTGSLSEAEEKTIKAVCEQMKSFRGDRLGGDTATSGIYETVRSEVRRAISDIQNDLESAIRRNNATAIATADVTEIPPDLFNPGAVELVLDIRKEYAIKLEESQERARKLRADLAVEEHRGQELSRILKETLPDPKTSSVQRSRPGRRTSSERKKMSKRLTEEAMSYFDECVSISTFDSSDFSASEDPPLSAGATTMGSTASLPKESPCISASCGPSSRPKHKQESIHHGQFMQSRDDFGTANSRSNETTIDQGGQRGKNTEWCRRFQFSFGHNPIENVGLQQDIRSYIKNFEKGVGKDGINSEIVRSNYFDIDEYDSHSRTESLLFDRVFFKNRIEAGSLHLCGGGISASVI